MADTAIFRTTAGTLIELDLPAEGTAAHERHEEQVRKGELTRFDGDVERVDVPGGGWRYEPVAEQPAPEQARPRKAQPKANRAAEPGPEGDAEGG